MQKPKIIIEPGRVLIEDSFCLITKVINQKLIFNMPSLTVNAGSNLSSTFFSFNHPVKALSRKKNKGEIIAYDIYGSLCMQDDLLCQTIKLPKVKVGDYLVIKSIVAYSYSRSNNFIRPRVNIVAIRNKKSRIVRKGETFKDITYLEKI